MPCGYIKSLESKSLIYVGEVVSLEETYTVSNVICAINCHVDMPTSVVLLLEAFTLIQLDLPGRKVNSLQEKYIVGTCLLWFPGAWGDAFSSTCGPSLQQLCLFYTQGVSKLTICSGSLVSLHLHTVQGLQLLTIVSPMLIDLRILNASLRGSQWLASLLLVCKRSMG